MAKKPPGAMGSTYTLEEMFTTIGTQQGVPTRAFSAQEGDIVLAKLKEIGEVTNVAIDRITVKVGGVEIVVAKTSE